MSHRRADALPAPVVNITKLPTKRMSGAPMDRPAPKRARNWWAVGGAILVASIAIGSVWQFVPHGLRVHEIDLRIATAERAVFRNDLLVRATAAPAKTLLLDALETGRVEEILVDDGALVTKGALLFRLSNPQLRLNLVAREADRAQQISNLSLLRVALESSQTDHQRRLLDLQFALASARRDHARNVALQEKGLIPARTLEESADLLTLQEQALEQEKSRVGVETRIKRDGIRQMEQAIERLDAGLKVVNESIDALDVRAPIAGRLTDFHLQLGEIVKPEQRLGRIDDPGSFKLVAELDEYFLGRIAEGQTGLATTLERSFPVKVARVFPQITDGRFRVDLAFSGDQPRQMSPGQSAETRLALGESTPALVIPNDSWLTDSSGQWAFVLTRDGDSATRRPIRAGRRNNSQVEITAGLEPGERVIVSGYASFGTATRLQVDD
jgi:HlyD family secretion protein